MKNIKYSKFIAVVAVFALSATFLLLDDEPISFADETEDHRSLRTGEKDEDEPTGVITDGTPTDETMATSASDAEPITIDGIRELKRLEDLVALPETTDSNARTLATDDILATHEWPTTEMTNIEEGTYSISRLSTQTNNGKYGRVLLYVTSHMSQQHKTFLKYCWPNILARSTLLQEVDVAVYLNPKVAWQRKEAMDVLNTTFADHNLKVYLRPNAGKQAGAKTAMYEAITSNFFSGYDWVIRLNPDVIVRDDSFLMESMADPSVSALLINCEAEWGGSGRAFAGLEEGLRVNTDFFVIKPDVLTVKHYLPLTGGNAEFDFTSSIQESVLDNGSHRWIPDASPRSPACRAGDRKAFSESPIVHQHTYAPEFCSIPAV